MSQLPKPWRYLLLLCGQLCSFNSLAVQPQLPVHGLSPNEQATCDMYLATFETGFKDSETTADSGMAHDSNYAKNTGTAKNRDTASQGITHSTVDQLSANANGTECQYQLGKRLLDEGLALPEQQAALSRQKRQSAKTYLQLAAQQNHAYAQYTLGMLLITGDEQTNNPAQSYQLMRQAALAGVPEAQGFLARMYAFGIGTKQDYSQALDWLHRAIQSGNSTAMLDLGRCYMQGDCGLEQDLSEAKYWFQRAHTAGNPSAELQLFYLDLQTNEAVDDSGEVMIAYPAD